MGIHWITFLLALLFAFNLQAHGKIALNRKYKDKNEVEFSLEPSSFRYRDPRISRPNVYTNCTGILKFKDASNQKRKLLLFETKGRFPLILHSFLVKNRIQGFSTLGDFDGFNATLYTKCMNSKEFEYNFTLSVAKQLQNEEFMSLTQFEEKSFPVGSIFYPFYSAVDLDELSHVDIVINHHLYSLTLENSTPQAIVTLKTPELQFKWLPIPSHYEEPSTLSYCRGIFHATTEALGPSFSQFECSGEASCSSMKSVTFKLQEGFDPGHVFKLGRFYVSCDVHPPKRDEHHPFTRVFDILVEKITKTDLNNLRVLPIKINDRTIFLTSTTFQYTYSMKLETPRLDIQFNPNLVEHHGFKIHKLVGNIHLLPTKPMLTPTSVNVHPHLFFCLETKCSLPFTYLFVNEKNVTLKDPHSLRDQTASLTFSFFFYDGLTHFLTVNYSASMKFD